MGKKKWLSMHPRNFGFDKIVHTYVHVLMLADAQGICKWQLSKWGTRRPVSHDCIAGSGVQLAVVICFFFKVLC